MVARRKWTDAQLEKAVKENDNPSDVLRALGLVPIGGNFRTIKIHIERLGLSTKHFDDTIRYRKGLLCTRPGNKRTLQEVEDRHLKKGSTIGSSHLKKHLLGLKILKNECSICSINTWLGSHLVLHLDHINGDSLDNRLINLRLLCPNCHSQTDTYCGKNIKKKPKKQKLCGCGKQIDRKSTRCRSCVGKMRPTKIDWPSTKELIEMVKETSYTATGKMLGVSDKSVRKRIKNYPDG